MEDTIYSVSQAVKLLETQSHVLRYWEDELALPIKRNEMGHRYYPRWDIQVFLSIKELKKRGYSLKEIGELTPFFYPDQVLDKKKSGEKKKKTEAAPGKARIPERIPSEFMDIISRLVVQRLKEQNSEEARYKRLDQRIRDCQQSRREVAASAEKKQGRGKLLHGSIKKKNKRR